MLLFPVLYALQTILVGIFTGPAIVAWLYLLSLPLTGYFALFWSNWYKRWKAGLRYRNMKKNRDEKILRLESQFHEINQLMDDFVDEYQKKNEHEKS